MKTHHFHSTAALIAAVVALSLPAWAIAQQPAPSGGGAAAQNSPQGTPSASGQNSSDRPAQGSNSPQGSGNADRGSGAQDRASQGSTPPSQADRSRPERSTPDASDRRDGATNRDTTDQDGDATDRRATEPSERRTTNRVDSRREDNNDDRQDRGSGRREADDDDNDADRSDRSTDDDDADRTGDRDRDVDFGARFTTDSSNRLVIGNLQPRGIFGRAGLRDNDVIISVNGQRVSSQAVLHRLLIGANSRVTVVIWRDGAQRTVYLDDLGVQTRNRTNYGYDDEFYQTDRAWLGVILDTRYDNAVVVQTVHEGSAADEAGIRAGDRIMSINGRRVQTPSQLTQIIGSMEPGDHVDIDVARWQTRQVEAELGERPATSSRFRYLEDDTRSAQPSVDINRGESRDDVDASPDALRVQP